MNTCKDVSHSRSPLHHLEYLTALLRQQGAIGEWLPPALARVADAVGATSAALCTEGLPPAAAEACDLTLSPHQREWVRRYGSEHADASSGMTVLLVDGKRAGGNDHGFAATGWRSALLAVFSVGDAGRAALVIGYVGNHLFSDGDVAFSRAAAHVLATGLEQSASGHQGEISRAKREWEATVDSLPQVVCLLDSKGHVLRVNRAVERWGIGDIRGLRGQDGSCVLEPLCPSRRCASRATYRRFWHGPDRRGEVTWEADCQALARTIRMTLRRLYEGDSAAANASSYAVMVIDDITEQRQAEVTLREYSRRLEAAVEERTVELAEANAKLRQEVAQHREDKSALARSEAESRALSARLMEVQEAERKRFASELHDSIGQSLTAIKFALEAFMHGPAPDGDMPELVLRKVREAMDETRRIAMDLRPAMLDDLGLVPTLEWFCREFQRLYGALRVDAAFCVDEHSIDPAWRVPVFRITQEAMNNAAKHACATCLQVSLRERGGRLVLRITDDGVGLSGAADAGRGGGFGLRSMRERAEMADGRVQISSSPAGTVVEASWALDSGERRLKAPVMGRPGTWPGALAARSGKPRSHRLAGGESG